jgi:hypothetical protein
MPSTRQNHRLDKPFHIRALVGAEVLGGEQEAARASAKCGLVWLVMTG